MINSSKNKILLSWQAPEYHQRERHPDWEWLVSIIALIAIILAMIFKNFLFALIIFLGSSSLILLERRHPSWPKIDLTDKGVRVGSDFYSYETVRSFWVEDNKDIDVLVLHSGRAIFPYIHIYFNDVDPQEVQRILAKYLPEIKPHDTIVDKIGEYFGF
ncbi:MAG: hypothetical protein UT40_C0025G0001 [Candidatus Woesebacteria bacterium GW2011_GWA1_39_21b]|uniref:DUF5673 domain-containing protein n=1 Tax=Candidatus Woesebacteria bacterium GW2011_GWA1_39_21b TaxID=1618551 RepID=A0A0G0NJW7_9BACT|nr:MAG: hypothetical protein UT40_C0025G0001 [Candidatus Woesebacteria bacterium GW2011_GWA1_39_21b]